MNNIIVNQVKIIMDNKETLLINLDDPNIIGNVSKQLNNNNLIKKVLSNQNDDGSIEDTWYFEVNRDYPIKVSTFGVVSLAFETFSINKYGDKISVTLNNNGTLETLSLYELYYMLLMTADHRIRKGYSIYDIGVVKFTTHKYDGSILYFYNQRQLKQRQLDK